MIGVALLCATLWQNTAHPPHLQKITIVFALALALLTARTHLRARQWGDVEKFYLNEIANGGASLRILNNLGMYYADHSQLAKAEEYYQKAIDMSKDIGMPQPYFNMASLYLTQGRASDAIRQLRISLAIDHRFVYSLNLLIQIYQAMGDDRRTSALREAMGAVVAGKDYDYAGLEALVFGS